MKFTPVAGQFLRAQIVRTIQSAGHDAHGLLGIVSAMAEAVSRGGEQLELAEPGINSSRSFIAQKPVDGDHEHQAQNETHDGRHHNEDQGLVPALGNNHMPSGSHDGRAGVAANQGM